MKKGRQKIKILAITLSLAILVGWQFLMPTQRPLPAAATKPQAVADTRPRDAAIAPGPRVPIDTPSVKGSLSLIGGRLDDLSLVKYHESPDPQSPAITLLSPALTMGHILAELGNRDSS